jgi:hypothetical protein
MIISYGILYGPMPKSRWKRHEEVCPLNRTKAPYYLSNKGNTVTLTVTPNSMYDTIKMVLPCDSPALLYERLERKRQWSNEETGEVLLRGRLANLNVSIGANTIVKIEGSLPKYYYGNNLNTLSLQDATLAFEKLGDELGLNVLNGQVYRLDTATNLYLRHPVHHVLNSFGELPKHGKGYIRNGKHISLIYKNSRREVKFYDKKLEMIEKRSWQDLKRATDNICRYELSIFRGLSAQFRKPNITVATLILPEFYNSSIDFWEKCYNLIHKSRKQKKLSDMKINTVPMLLRFLSAQAY